MNVLWKRYKPVAVLMAIIVLLTVVLTCFTGTGSVDMSIGAKMVVVTTHPLYVAVKNVIGETASLTVENLTGTSTGCLHDYQLSPKNRITLANASLLLLNGGGAEHFLEDTLAAMPELKTVDTSASITLMESGHEHTHGDEHAVNEHVWMSSSTYASQVSAVISALCALDGENAETYVKNGSAYRKKVLSAGARLRSAARKLPSKNCIIFHDSMAYLAKELGLTVVASLHVGEESGVSAAALAEAQQAAMNDPDMILLYDSQYPIRYSAIDALVPASHVVAVDTAVTGTDWLDAMAENVERLKRVKEGEQ